ncbi:MFS transporter [Rhizobium oryziradicis]|uniref:MFS transporter n=1 Tax=Rhizobium oryziradicis TaxID=1867956 RepID=A0A1Q8ZPQ0_9HYPH|nr:MFS transporter [Rhizobium oryziradicis]OLP43697.1 MFS transporter [Rhizobium oryziradicis]
MSINLSCQSAAGQRSSGGISVIFLAVSAFLIVTTEFIIVGMLPGLARDLGISVSAAGQLVTLFAFTVMLAGPFLTAMVSHFERKRLFVSILALFAISNAIAALAPNIWVLGIGRFIPALALPVFWGTASETAGQLAGSKRASKAIAQVYMGIAAAMVLGIPLGTLIADALGWRGTFWTLAALSLLMAILLGFFMPTMAKPEKMSALAQAQILKDPFFRGNIILSVVVFTAMFTAYTYLADILETMAGVPSAQVGWWLMGFGLFGLIGNWLGGNMVERGPVMATGVATMVLAGGMIAATAFSSSHILLIPALAAWGIANTALYPICQIRVMKAASHAQALAGTLNVSMANAGIGLGALIGGAVIQRWSLSNLGYVAAAIALMAILISVHVARLKPHIAT